MIFIKKFLNFIFKHKIILGLNYHRVGEKTLNDPFSGLHTVKYSLFKLQINIINFFFKIVSLDDLQKGNIKSKINFFISFDDVPSISKQAFNWLEKKKIPFVICPNIKFTEEGYNISDKFRFAINKVKQNEIEQNLQKYLNEREYNYLKQNGLKKLYKSYMIDQKKFEKIFLERVFKDLSLSFMEKVKKKNYLDWNDIKLISEKNIIASHGKNHYNFFFLNSEEIYNELKSSKDILESKLNNNIFAFAIPFGAYSQHLAIMVTEAAKKLGYKQILWAGSQGIIYNRPNNYHIQHLFRFNAPDNFLLFLKTIIASIKNTKLISIETKELVNNYDKKNFDFRIVENPPIQKILAYENIIRPYRYYSSNKSFIENIYVNNPFRSELPYAYALSRDGVLNSVSYHLYKNYYINNKVIKIVEHSGWRKINSLSTNENVKLYLLVSKMCKAFYHWRPSKSVAPGCKNSPNFFEIPNKEFIFKIHKYKISQDHNIKIYDKCPKTINLFLKKFNNKFYFTLERSEEFYKWRIDNYPIGEKKYFVFKKDNQIFSMLVAQIYNNKAMILDLVSLVSDKNIYLIKKFINYCNDKKINEVKFVTSNKTLIHEINKNFKFKHKTFDSYMYIKNLINENLIDKKLLAKSESFETYVSGDVLIR